MDPTPQRRHTAPMNHERLFDEAVRLAYQCFDDPTDGHITGVYAVIVWQAQRGIAPCVTVH
ncbi:hypothetical protein PT7_P075 (plasmid) [Pusillimonas sp. T7-7]|nr:hypothetical protein PT7_P075 [Pusillimonas sp. T7-7]